MQHRIKQTTSMSKEKANNDFAAFDEYLSQHSYPTDDWKEQPNLKDPHYNKTLQKVDRKGGQKSESVDRKGGQKTKVSIIRMIKDNPSISSIEMANLIGINRSAISKHLKKLKEDHIIKREGPAKGGKWIIITS